MKANGFYGYLDGSIECPPAQISNSEGTQVPNSKFALWHLIDTQLLMCLTASLSQITLPYILGLHHTHQVWLSLSNRYNSLSNSHVQDLKGRLYTITKTSTIEVYVDTIKEYAQKLVAAGSPVDDDDLVFHTLRGLPPVFNGFKTTIRAIRARGDRISFDEVVNMLHGEDLQLLQEPLAETSSTSVLVATHGSSQGQRQLSTGSSFLVAPSTQSVSQPFGSTNQSVGQLVSNTQVGSSSYYDPSSSQSNVGPANLTPSSSVTTSAQYIPPQFLPTSFRNFPRGRGRGPRMPCDICGRFNHTTNYCYYRPSFSQMVQQGSYSHPMVQQFPQQPYQQVPHHSFQNVSWRPPAQSIPWMNASNPWLNTPMNAPSYPSGIPMFHHQPPPYSRPPMVASQAVFQGPNTPSPPSSFCWIY